MARIYKQRTVASYDTYSGYIDLRIRDKLGYQLIHNRMFTFVTAWKNMYRATFGLKSGESKIEFDSQLVFKFSHK